MKLEGHRSTVRDPDNQPVGAESTSPLLLGENLVRNIFTRSRSEQRALDEVAREAFTNICDSLIREPFCLNRRLQPPITELSLAQSAYQARRAELGEFANMLDELKPIVGFLARAQDSIRYGNMRACIQYTEQATAEFSSRIMNRCWYPKGENLFERALTKALDEEMLNYLASASSRMERFGRAFNVADLKQTFSIASATIASHPLLERAAAPLWDDFKRGYEALIARCSRTT